MQRDLLKLETDPIFGQIETTVYKPETLYLGVSIAVSRNGRHARFSAKL